MSTSCSQQEALFADALARPAAERPEFLAQACGGNTELRSRLMALLAAHESPDNLLATRAISEMPFIPSERTGDNIGRYKLLQKLGEGGCGVVWMAEQGEPIRRRVALKVIKLGMDTREVLARFAAERQALAIMDHPNIAKVLDAGATESGRPYFVMELVRGMPITKYCDAQNLQTRERLGLFIRVCHAVQHAHQKGIIHRDLKPSNILVGMEEATAVPKVIDFGIAKATQGPLTDATVVTAIDQFIGTPAYMSPEQAALTNLDIDTRSDVYSLGVLLYELLVGRPPFDPKTLLQSSREEIRRIIRDVEPDTPSRRLSTLEMEERRNAAKLRATDPAHLSVMLSGDLDWIVMKALEKNRARRYETPTALAADITHFLNSEPVGARPPSKTYRFGKMVQRNRLAFAAIVVVGLSLATATTFSTWQAVRARRAEQLANHERGRALDMRVRADELLEFIVRDLRKPLEKVGQLGLLDAVAQKALDHFSSLDPRESDRRMLMTNVAALTQLGGLRMDQSRYADAEKAYAEAHARALLLVASNPQDPQALFARSQAEWGKGFVRFRRGDIDGAREWFVHYRDTVASLIALQPDELRWQRELASGDHNLAALEKDYGSPERARESFRSELATLNKLLASAPEDLDLRTTLADAISYLGSLAEMAGDYVEAAQRFAEQSAQFETLRGIDPNNTHWRFKLADSLSFEATVQAITGKRDLAAQHLAHARQLLEALVAGDPTNRRWSTALLVVDLKEAQLAEANRDLPRALQLVGAARTTVERLAAQEPTDVRFQYRLAMALRVTAELQSERALDLATEMITRANDVAEKLVAKNGTTHAHRAERADTALVAGRIAALRGDTVTAQRYWRQASELLAPLVAATNDWRVLDPAARAAALLGRTQDAQELVARLTRVGYVPIEAWPAAAATANSASNR